MAIFLAFGALIGAAHPAAAQFTQQGSKLVGTGATGNAVQGYSVALSADGSTLVVGGLFDNSDVGAAWVYTRSGSVWTQQGSKLVGTGATGQARQGNSVALSADGNTAIVGGDGDNSNVGAAWVFTRSGAGWTQQGSKLIGTGAAGGAEQGTSVALSADGNTAVVGGQEDNSRVGAAWVFTRSGGVWTQQGSKLVGTGAAGDAHQGASVTLSADGNTAIVGGPTDNSFVGAAWVFTRSGGVWSQQGSKLVGSGYVANPTVEQGGSVALSADGNTAIVGGLEDNSGVGAAWVFTRSGGVWTQQGSKLVGSGNVGVSFQGDSVALSADGNTAIVGGGFDNSGVGAAWVFTRSGSTWTQQGSKLVGTGAVGTANQGISVALSAAGTTAIVGGNGDNSEVGAAWVFAAPYFNPVATHDFNGDGYSDIAWRNTSGDVAIWLMNGTQVLSAPDVGNVPISWTIVGQRPLNNSGYADLIWRNTSGDVAIWLMNGAQILSAPDLGNVPISWSIAGSGAFKPSNGYAELFWRNTNGDVAIWQINGTQVLAAPDLGNVPTSWTIAGTGDFAGTGNTDILWRNADGDVAIWFMNGTQVVSAPDLGNVPTS
jgi:hypothetical protein